MLVSLNGVICDPKTITAVYICQGMNVKIRFNMNESVVRPQTSYRDALNDLKTIEIILENHKLLATPHKLDDEEKRRPLRVYGTAILPKETITRVHASTNKLIAIKTRTLQISVSVEENKQDVQLTDIWEALVAYGELVSLSSVASSSSLLRDS